MEKKLDIRIIEPIKSTKHHNHMSPTHKCDRRTSRTISLHYICQKNSFFNRFTPRLNFNRVERVHSNNGLS